MRAGRAHARAVAAGLPEGIAATAVFVVEAHVADTGMLMNRPRVSWSTLYRSVASL